MDVRDAILQQLDVEIETADEQTRFASQHHGLHVRRMLDIQDERLKDLERNFQADIGKI